MAIYNYQTEPLTDFTKEENIKKYEEGLRIVESYLGKTYPIIIDGKRIETEKKMVSLQIIKKSLDLSRYKGRNSNASCS